MTGASTPSQAWRGYGIGIAASLGALLLAYSFWSSSSWMTLCAGVALFLFGMQCLEEGLKNLAGDTLEQVLARGTSTRPRSFLIGFCGTAVLQSSTLVSLMTIAFISTGLIGLTAGVAIILGANLGSTTGIWLLALAGQNISLSPLALPLLVFGVVASFFGPKPKAAGRILLGIAFIFLGIDAIKSGFSTVTENLDLTQYEPAGWLGYLLFGGIGLVLTLVLQSTHATLMLTLTALSLGQVELIQGAAIAIGAKVGSSVTTGIAGALGGNRRGQQLALSHVIFNVATAIVAFALLGPQMWLTGKIAGFLGFGDNELMMLAIFHSMFTTLGIVLFWPFLDRFTDLLERILPERGEPPYLLPGAAPAEQPIERSRARYLTSQALQSLDTAATAVMQELRHLARLSMEVICHALYLPVSELDAARHDESLIAAAPDADYVSAEALYQRHIKGVYGDLLSFMGRVDIAGDDAHRDFWTACQVAALQLVETVKDAKQLQKNLAFYLRQPDSPARAAYVDLRRHLITVLHDVRSLAWSDATGKGFDDRLQELAGMQEAFEAQFRDRLVAELRADRIDGLQLSSLLNDLGYAARIAKGLSAALLLRQQGPGKLRDLSFSSDDSPLIVLP
ncbi:Na/Pi symporter [Sinorhizobium sp. BG8]|uniref:Na/Pi cotransporter family protein n=1 Tax=Sinorhizobium sp. BG8 TaxID=2613773 RepID=UPI00193CA7BC|nr:Na/Pi symporter [Sinorhizobium sp. BG8]QRM54824.1 Na/Pi cotransporter family protein [Sinorhizobium sp. BG8]